MIVTATEVLTALEAHFGILGNHVVLDMSNGINTSQGVTLDVVNNKGQKTTLPQEGNVRIDRQQLVTILELALWGELRSLGKPNTSDTGEFLSLDLTLEPYVSRTLTPAIMCEVLARYTVGLDLAFKHGDYDVAITKHKHKPRELKRLGQLKGETIKAVKTVQKGAKAYIRTESGGAMVLVNPEVKDDLAPDELIALGLLTKEDLASIAKAKKMGLLL